MNIFSAECPVCEEWKYIITDKHSQNEVFYEKCPTCGFNLKYFFETKEMRIKK